MVKDTVTRGWKTEGLHLHCQTNINLLRTLEEGGESQTSDIVNLVIGKGMRKIIEKTLCTEDRMAQNTSYFYLIILLSLVPCVHLNRILRNRYTVHQSTVVSQSALIHRLSWPRKPNFHLEKKPKLFQAKSFF